MIKATRIPNEDRKHRCHNCDRRMELLILYDFITFVSTEPYARVKLCEDCSGAIGMLRTRCLAEEKSFIYDKDEIQEI